MREKERSLKGEEIRVNEMYIPPQGDNKNNYVQFHCHVLCGQRL